MKCLRHYGRFRLEMASPKKELMMLRMFRLTLPAALLVSLTWMTLFTDSARQAVINSLGANANIIIFILGLFLVIGLYWVMGVYERKILDENHHTRPAF
jgi:hypothetical protein